ncbi:unnamed protein product [Callosobruchus maculatus]|uniref:C2H2-type domain-containing protein n=1 Tax=Callosobruchus maculatus TaxID=64391 RepID=A0A653BX11_CALMS|nr:unnamed protein product [Callosobruchus maculatus]
MDYADTGSITPKPVSHGDLQKKFTCSVCNSKYTMKKTLLRHFKSKHPQHLTVVCKVWSIYRRYVKRCSTKLSKIGEKRATYYCHRSGTFKSRSKGHRKIKKQGTKKIGKDCPARMYVKVSTTGEVTIDYIQTHVGHDDDEIYHCLVTDKKNSTVSDNKMPTMNVCYNAIVKEVKNDELFDPKARDISNNKDQKIIDKCFDIVSTKDAETENQELWVTEEPSKTPELPVATPETFVESKIHFINDLVQLVNDNINSPEELVEATKMAKPLLERLKEAAKKKGAATNMSIPKMDIVEFQTIQTPTSIQIIHATPAQPVQLQHIHLMEGTQVFHGLAQMTHLATHGTSGVEQESLSLPLIKLDSIFQAV